MHAWSSGGWQRGGCAARGARRLAGWGHARLRVIRGENGIGWPLCPRRSRCPGCGVTHVLLPVGCLLRRADGVAVIWAALAGKAGGLGYRPLARLLGRPESTVRDWLARFASRAELIRGVFTAWLCALDADPPPLPPAGSRGRGRAGRYHRGSRSGTPPLGGAAGQPVAG